MMRNQKSYVIVGAGAAGMAAAAVIGRQDAAARITVLSAEGFRPYFRPMLPFLISGQKDPLELALENRGPFMVKGVNIRLSTKAVALDHRHQKVILDNGEELIYDKLLIATGSNPTFPKLLQQKAIGGVYTLRTKADALTIFKCANVSKEVVLLGGGMLNIKTAFALLALGLKVTLVEAGESILPWLMEADATVLIHNALLKAGLRVITGCTLRRLFYDHNNRVRGVELTDGQKFACQMLLVGMGIEPEISLFKRTPLTVNQGLVIDKHCACSIENIFAAGDVAEIENIGNKAGPQVGLWTRAVEMGRCAGFNMTGQISTYDGAYKILNATQVADLAFVTMGTVHTADTDFETYVFSTKRFYRKLVFSSQGNRLIGTVFVGDITNAGLYRYLIQNQLPVADIKSFIIGHRLHYGHLIAKAA